MESRLAQGLRLLLHRMIKGIGIRYKAIRYKEIIIIYNINSEQ